MESNFQVRENKISMFLFDGQPFREVSKMVALPTNFNDAGDRWLSEPARSRGRFTKTCCILCSSSQIRLSSGLCFTPLGRSPRVPDLLPLPTHLCFFANPVLENPKISKIVFLSDMRQSATPGSEFDKQIQKTLAESLKNN